MTPSANDASGECENVQLAPLAKLPVHSFAHLLTSILPHLHIGTFAEGAIRTFVAAIFFFLNFAF